MLVIICLLFGSLLAGSGQKMTKQAAPASSGKYDCDGGLGQESLQGEIFVNQAIDDALKTLSKCAPCRSMFDSEDEKYAIKLLQRLRKNKAFVISLKYLVMIGGGMVRNSK